MIKNLVFKISFFDSIPSIQWLFLMATLNGYEYRFLGINSVLHFNVIRIDPFPMHKCDSEN